MAIIRQACMHILLAAGSLYFLAALALLSALITVQGPAVTSERKSAPVN